MAFKPGNINRMEQLNEEAKPFKGYSSALENFQAGVGQVFDEELSVSSAINDIGSAERADQVKKLTSEGYIPESIIKSFTTKRGHTQKVDYDSIAKYANEYLDLDKEIPTTEQLTKWRDEDLAQRRKYREDIYDRALGGGDVSAFAGSMIGAGLDPVNYIPIGGAAISGAKATSRAMYSLAMAKKGAIGGVVAAAAIEPFIFSWKEEIGVEYTTKDAMFNLAASGIMSGAIAGVAGNLAHRIRSKRQIKVEENRSSLVDELVEKEGIDKDQAEDIAQFIYESQVAPKKDMPAEEFIQKTEDTQDSMNTSTRATDDSKPTIGPEDTEVIDKAFDELDEDFTGKEFELMMDDDGNMMVKSSFAEADIEYQARTDELEEKLGCLLK